MADERSPPSYHSNQTTYQQFPMSPLTSPPHVPASSGDAGGVGGLAQEVHRQLERPEEEKKLKDLGEIDPASLIPGKGPGGVPQQYFTLEFEDVFEEHIKTTTFSTLYKVLGLVYKYTKLVVYHIFVILIGIPLMLLWAILNSITTFTLVWIWGPLLRLFIVLIYSTAPAYYVPVQAVLSPIMDSFGRLFRQCVFRIKLDGKMNTGV